MIAAGQGMVQMLMMKISDLFDDKSQWIEVDSTGKLFDSQMHKQGTSINVQKGQSINLSAVTLCNVTKENHRVCAEKDDILQKPLSKWIH
ncbi:hypothetical protein Tco_0655706 [Tanacetum coccineum]|uniref:Uncharacterized protein n=1 Tax=Tanacetum coccineum TaxID=301880 RepID=A0ABQ4X737_9ASTR